ncbi:SAV_915 family protein [Streptomyces chiangmaiensis]|uniref:SAV_915 family protein n=1 Tax=Streptomyces chiangmaiensis TaxID=766497 RepID=A0ABU7FU54_9ACTN|nr:SAV_915 family protein [Streptomyces chiangmaiensis]MED7827488.1 SAV_915 family protein [Streptomyces chiangmaiensis]
MTDILCGEDPEPCERFPAGPLFVPVRSGPAGCAARIFRTPLGDRTAVGFTSKECLTATLGSDQAWIRLAEPALRALIAPLGVTTVTVDPQFSAPAPAPTTRATELPRVPEKPPVRSSRTSIWDPQAVGVLRVTGAAALVSALALWIG